MDDMGRFEMNVPIIIASSSSTRFGTDAFSCGGFDLVPSGELADSSHKLTVFDVSINFEWRTKIY